MVDVQTGEPIAPVVVDGNTGAPIGTRPLSLVMPSKR
jgi:hypothetical protein